MKKYIIRFNGSGVLAIAPVGDGSEILGVSQMLITSLERAKTMLQAIGADTTAIDNYKEPEEENGA